MAALSQIFILCSLFSRLLGQGSDRPPAPRRRSSVTPSPRSPSRPPFPPRGEKTEGIRQVALSIPRSARHHRRKGRGETEKNPKLLLLCTAIREREGERRGRRPRIFGRTKGEFLHTGKERERGISVKSLGNEAGVTPSVRWPKSDCFPWERGGKERRDPSPFPSSFFAPVRFTSLPPAEEKRKRGQGDREFVCVCDGDSCTNELPSAEEVSKKKELSFF